MKKIILSFAVLLFLMPQTVFAQDEAIQGFRATDLPLPRFVSLRSEKTYVRTGPALRYPIKWVYKQKGLPVEIVQEFDAWRKVKDYEGDFGWVHQSLLTGDRTVLIDHVDPIPVRQGFSSDSKMVARFEPLVTASLKKCADDWCRVETHGYDGWVERKYLWGIYDSEDLD
jgi:SH3-like domain-containing protein